MAKEPAGGAHQAGTATIAPFPNFTAQGLDRLRQMYAMLPPSREALAALFAVQAAQTAPSEQWSLFFVETASAQLIWDERPTGILTAEDADWLIARFDEAPSIEVLALLGRVLEEANRVPAGFVDAVRERASLFRPRMLDEASAETAPRLRVVS